MPKIMEIIEKETKGKSYHIYQYSYDSVGVPSIDQISSKRASLSATIPLF